MNDIDGIIISEAQSHVASGIRCDLRSATDTTPSYE